MRGHVAKMTKSLASGASVGAMMQVTTAAIGTGALPNVAAGVIALPVPNRSQLDAFNVNREGWEAITNTLYDSIQYPVAGAGQLSFFNLPVGQGVNWTGVGAKNLSDTNMSLAGQMPANQEFLIQSIEVELLTATPTVAAAMPAYIAATVATSINDAYIFYRAGNLNLQIGAKSYCQEAPLMKFPAKAFFEITAAATTEAAGSIAWATARGRPFLLKAPLRLVSNQNFGVQLNWPEGAQAITAAARVFIILDGVFYRRSQ
jgi:hypothetical protein